MFVILYCHALEYVLNIQKSSEPGKYLKIKLFWEIMMAPFKMDGLRTCS